MTMKKLSKELIQLIQNFGDTPEQCNLCTTCKRYNKEIDITYLCRFDMGIFKVFRIYPITIDLYEVGNVNLSTFFNPFDLSELRELYMNDKSVASYDDIKSVLMKTNLTALRLGVALPEQLDDKCILHNKNLKILRLESNCEITDASISKLDLHKLELWECKGVSDAGLVENKNLQSLSLSMCPQITTESLSKLQLKTLILNNTGWLEDDDIATMFYTYEEVEDQYFSEEPYSQHMLNCINSSKTRIESQKDTLEVLDIYMDPYIFDLDLTMFPKLKKIICFKLSSIRGDIILNNFKLMCVSRISNRRKEGIITIGSREIMVLYTIM
jgi:hypothetical protein